MKYLVVGEYDPDNTEGMLKKAKAWMEDKEKYPDRYPDSLFPAHHMLNTSKFMSIWVTDDEEKMANKIAFMLPEVKYEVIPLVSGKTFMKQYMEVKK